MIKIYYIFFLRMYIKHTRKTLKKIIFNILQKKKNILKIINFSYARID